MTKINKLVLNGFKSFAKHTEIQFGDKFNCVLGPNGSGKSNILDALCFVLGKAGAKGLRAEKSANLIYNGGKTKKPAKKGEVSIYFDNNDKTFPTEELEVKVTRIIKDNGQSVYKINDQTRTRTQILDLLRIARIDPDGYNIILQGDIVRFCEMASTERRLLIEEISGISIYEEKKNKAINQLNKVEERLKEAEIILTERKTYLKDLKKDRDQALKFKELNDNIKKYKATLIKMSMDKREEELKDLNEKIDTNTSQFQKSTEKITKLKEEIVKYKEEIEKITKEIEEKGETDQVNLNKEIENIKIEITKKNTRLETLDSEIIKLSNRKVDIKKETEDIKEKITKLDNDKETFLESKKEKDKQKEEFSKKISNFKKKNNIDEASDIESKVDQIDKNTEELLKDINFMRETQHNLLREKDKVEHELNSIQDSITKVAEIEKEHKNQLDDLKEKRDLFKSTTLELNKLLDEDSNLAIKISTARTDLNNSNEQLAKLNARNASLNEFTASDKAVNAILKQKVQGVYGTVSQLGTVDSKYSEALDVAAGARIKSIVVENDKIASDQIKFLKQNKLGVASFIPLNKIKEKTIHKDASKLIKAKGSYGKASDLVKFDTKFKKVFSHVFGDTLVIDDIDAARRLGIGNAKMVTLDGDVTDISGAMRGGFRDKRKKHSGFNEADLNKDIDKQEKTVQELEANLSSFESRRAEVDQKITELRNKKGELEGEIIKSEKSLHLDDSDLSLSRKKMKDIQDKHVSVEKEINEIQNKISSKNKDLAKLKIERQQLRSKISELRSPTLLAELSTYEEKSRQLNEELLKINSEISNIDIQIKDIFNPEIEKTSLIVKQIEKDQETFKTEKEILSKKIQDEDKILKTKEEEAKSFYAKFKQLFNKRSEVTDSINKNENDISSINEKSREVEIKNNTLSIKKAEVNASLSGLKEEFSQYEGIQLDPEKNEEQLKYQVQKFERMKDEIGTVNMRALEIYEEIEKEYNKLMDKRNTLETEKNDVEGLMNEIESKKKDLFMKTYDSVNGEFQKIFLSLSKKGEASLELEDKEDPFAEGVRIKVRLTGQKFLDIRSLSGGEKTMTALAFIFAIQEHEPASFYILDEVDAALDKTNSEKLAKLVASYSDHAQYIIITHNDGIISNSDNLYGISMDEHGISKVVSLKV